jgi:hypothetical protein
VVSGDNGLLYGPAPACGPAAATALVPVPGDATSATVTFTGWAAATPAWADSAAAFQVALYAAAYALDPGADSCAGVNGTVGVPATFPFLSLAYLQRPAPTPSASASPPPPSRTPSPSASLALIGGAGTPTADPAASVGGDTDGASGAGVALAAAAAAAVLAVVVAAA